MDCPKCGATCDRESADVGVGVIYGPWGCPDCQWSEDPKYDLSSGQGRTTEQGGLRDQYGGVTPAGGWSCGHPYEEVTLTKDDTMWEGYDARCSACGHEWYVTAEEYRQMHPPTPRKPEAVKDDIIF